MTKLNYTIMNNYKEPIPDDYIVMFESDETGLRVVVEHENDYENWVKLCHYLEIDTYLKGEN